MSTNNGILFVSNFQRSNIYISLATNYKQTHQIWLVLIHTRTHAYIHTLYIYIYIHTHTHIYTHIYTFTLIITQWHKHLLCLTCIHCRKYVNVCMCWILPFCVIFFLHAILLWPWDVYHFVKVNICYVYLFCSVCQFSYPVKQLNTFWFR